MSKWGGESIFFPLFLCFKKKMWLNLIKRELGSVQPDSLLIHKVTFVSVKPVNQSDAVKNTSQQNPLPVAPSNFNTTHWSGSRYCLRVHVPDKQPRWKTTALIRLTQPRVSERGDSARVKRLKHLGWMTHCFKGHFSNCPIDLQVNGWHGSVIAGTFGSQQQLSISEL